MERVRSRYKLLFGIAGVAAILMLVGLTGVDRPLAEAIRGSELAHARVFDRGTEMLDLVTLKAVTHNLLGGAIALAGLLWWAAHRRSRAAKITTLTGLCSFATSYTVILLKGMMGRLRPVETFERGDWDHTWFAGGSSFPSGHSAYYFGLALPLAIFFPRARWPLIALATFVAIARLDISVHFVSDVSASVVIAAGYALLAARAYERWAAEPLQVIHEKPLP